MIDSLTSDNERIQARPEGLGTAVFGWDVNGKITSWSRAAHALFGWAASEVVGRLPPFVLSAELEAYVQDCRATFGGRGDAVKVCSARTFDGRQLHVAIGISLSVDAAGCRYGVSTVDDIGARLVSGRRLAMFESVVVNSTDSVIITEAVPATGIRDRIVYVNSAFTAMTGYAAREAVGSTPRMLQGSQTEIDEVRRISRALGRRESVRAELTNYRKNGEAYSVEMVISPVHDDYGPSMYFISIQRETTKRRALATYERDRSVVLEMAVCNEPLATQLARIVLLLKSVIPGSLGTVMLVHDDRLTTGAADPAVSTAYLAAIDGARIGPQAGSCGTAIYQRTAVICGDIATDIRWTDYSALALRAGLRACWSTPFFDAQGTVLGAFALYADRVVWPTPEQLHMFEETARFVALVVDRHRDRERLERLAHYDALTQLPNRKQMEETLETALGQARFAKRSVVLGVLDVDCFKAINDAYGHHVGDCILRAIADRGSALLRAGETLGRMAGDEFLLVFAEVADATQGVERATRLLELFRSPFAVEGHDITVRASCGLACFPSTATRTLTLFQAADQAMYAAKKRGGGIELAPAVASDQA